MQGVGVVTVGHEERRGSYGHITVSLSATKELRLCDQVEQEEFPFGGHPLVATWVVRVVAGRPVRG